jgi:hypothetical protein
MNKSAFLDKLIAMRTLIGFLGEKEQFNWWDTLFLGKTALSYLQLNFPRTKFSAALHSVTEAAKKVHDDRIGKGNVNHIFRLTAHDEHQLANYLRDINPDQFLYLFESKETALSHLSQYVTEEQPLKQGPVQVDSDSFFTINGLKKAAAYYYQAFTSGVKTFPYIITD